jgi:hypothetical protein
MVMNTAAGVDDAVGAGGAAETAEHLGMDDAQAGTGQHGDGQFGNHGHVQGDAVAAFQAGKIPEQGGEFIHPHIEFLIGDVLVPSSFGSGTKWMAVLFLFLSGDDRCSCSWR